jgi:hypothetical protein
MFDPSRRAVARRFWRDSLFDNLVLTGSGMTP